MKVKCDYCGKQFENWESKIKRSKHHFCSTKCKSLFQQKQNTIIIKNNYAILKINNAEVLIDFEDIERINKFKWCAKFDKTVNNYYISAWERNKTEKTRKRVILHRFLMNTPKDMECDHINRNTLDNRKNNLRNIPQIENLQNKGFYKNNKSGFKYIYWNKTNNIYVCEIKKDKKVVFRKYRKDLSKLIMLRDEFLKRGDA